MPRIAFFGSDEIALPMLERITGAGVAEIVLVCSQPDRPAGRGRRVEPNAVVAWARARQIPVIQPEKPDAETAAALRGHRCDAALVMAYGHILRADLLAVPPRGFLNVHGSLLPVLRGASPIEGAIVSGMSETGASLQRVVRRLDAGDVLGAERVGVAPDETRLTLREKIAAAAEKLAVGALPAALAGTAAGVPQDEALATFTRKIARADAALDFRASARELAARARALAPWPGVTFPLGALEIKIGGAVAEPAGNAGSAGASDAPAGTVLSADADGVRISTGDGVLRVTHLQRPTAKMLPAGAFLAGFPLAVGTLLESRGMTPLVRTAAEHAAERAAAGERR
ncbi:MAG: methionyl-tRNA formyltransferase [Puniceicoccales bacterium]|jgi:methionyl-tRNA formyltransferase|nr:methionyl-tRNA formyltransferase [Puniceicoccales bacterium]